MKLNQKDVEELKCILAACKVLGIEGVVLHEGMARGAKPSLDAAIISETNLSISEALRLGIGRVPELEKRLAIFSDQVEIEGKSNETGDVSLLTLSSGRSKVQFRCTSVSLMKYPKLNDDAPLAMISFSKPEAQQISRAVKTLGAETIVLQVNREGTVKLECSDTANDRFSIELQAPAEFNSDHESAVQTYLAELFISLLDANVQQGFGALGQIDATFVLGQEGSITSIARNHTLLLFPQITGDD